MFLGVILGWRNSFSYWIAESVIFEKLKNNKKNYYRLRVFLRIMSFFDYFSRCLEIQFQIFGDDRWFNC